jgi:hypothetical protein
MKRGVDPLVDDVALLEEQLPRGDGRAHDPDDQKHYGGQLPGAARQLRDGKVMSHLRGGRVSEEVHGDQQQAAGAERHGDPLEPPEAAGERRTDDHRGGQGGRGDLRQAQVARGQRDPDELGDDRQRVEDEQVQNAERAPELAEPLQDEPGVPDPGDRAETQHHLLVHIQHRNQQQQCPQQPGAVILPGLPVGGERARVVVADHHDQPGADDGQQCLEVS